MTFMAYRSPGRSLLSANLTCEKAPLNTVDNYSYGYMSKYIFDKVTHVPRTSLRMYLSSTVGAFLAVDPGLGVSQQTQDSLSASLGTMHALKVTSRTAWQGNQIQVFFVDWFCKY